MTITDFLLTCGNLKKTKRTGWINHKVAQPESIADHMHRMGIICMAITDPRIDRAKLVKMAIVHDIAEAIAGDITPFDGISPSDKHQMELAAIDTYVQQLSSSAFALEVKALWLEYENGTTNEAMVCKDIDKYEMILQAYEYEKDGFGPLDSFFESTRGKFKHPEIITLVDELLQKRQELQFRSE
ncbi:HD domain-containing protein 2 [Kappamyces sp. JEL0829]|nr:HD domain-containing protein 2 [Kappamyces sp. JEL0829]